MEIKFDFWNELLRRREVQFAFQSENNPGFDNSRKILAEKFSINEDNISIKFVRSNFGERSFLVEAFIYDSNEGKKKIEPKRKVKKAGGGR